MLLLLLTKSVAQVDTSQVLPAVLVTDLRVKELSYTQLQLKQDSVQLLISPGVNMADWLQQTSNANVRQFAPGSAASYSTRGTSSEQSSIHWSGIPINSAATGIADLSLIPATLFSPVFTVGGNAAFFGSGAIGGTVNLADQSAIGDGFHVGISQQVASFNTFKTGLQLTYARLKWKSKSTVYAESSQNNYAYINQYKIPEREETRANAAYNQWHVKQLVGYKINKHQSAEIEAWYNQAYRESPTSILVNKPSNAVLRDRNLRTRALWQLDNNRNLVQASYAYLHEWQTFEDPDLPTPSGGTTHDTNITTNHVAQINYQYKISEKLKWQNGGQAQFSKVSGSNRVGNLHTESLRTGLALNTKNMHAQALVRLEVWDGELLPISPFLGLRYTFFRNFNASVNGSYVYRTPTLNQLYWVPGGNINLKPENGYTGEFALYYSAQKNRQNIFVRAALYASALNEYIQWVPGANSIWSPQNVKQVEIYGLDVNATYAIQVKQWYVALRGALSLNHAETVKSEKQNDQSVGNQVLYQPKLKTTSGFTIGFEKWYVNANYRFIGEVQTAYDGSGNSLDPYGVLDLSLSKTIGFKKGETTFIAAFNNITNQAYETVPYFPMPGRNFSITFKINI